jgi:hypothetical protein
MSVKSLIKMINETEVLDLLGNKIPELNPELERLSQAGNIYKTMQCFSDFTRSLIGNGNMQAVKNCINLAEELLQDGNNAVKNAVENVFLYSLAPMIDLGDVAGKALQKMLKGALRREYLRQVCSSGI